MNKKMPQTELHFCDHFFTPRREMISSEDFEIIDKHILSQIKESTVSIKYQSKLPKEFYIEPMSNTQVNFQLRDIPEQYQRNALAVLLTKFTFLSANSLQNVMADKSKYITISYTKYSKSYMVILEINQGMLKEKNDEELKQKKLAEKRREERKFTPTVQIRNLRNKPKKRLVDYHMLELAEERLRLVS